MTTTITHGEDIYTADLMDGYSATRASRNVLSPILGNNAVAVSSRGEAGLRSGTVRLLFTEWATAAAAYEALCSGEEMSLADTDREAVSMSFVTSGDITIELDDETRAVWWIEFDYQETD